LHDIIRTYKQGGAAISYISMQTIERKEVCALFFSSTQFFKSLINCSDTALNSRYGFEAMKSLIYPQICCGASSWRKWLASSIS
jgi:hypothetical protein